MQAEVYVPTTETNGNKVTERKVLVKGDRKVYKQVHNEGRGGV